MSVAFEMIDAPYPYLCAVYRCRCGAVEVRHGDEAAVPPTGWRVDSDDEGEPDAVCAHCVAVSAAPG
jgi:hypothetical protein